jgi:uncharacterized membrane protein YqhA
MLYYEPMLKPLLERSRYLVVIAVLACLAGALGAFGWGAFKTWHALAFLFESGGKDPLGAIKFIELMDVFLIATALLIFAIGLYELFIEDVVMPPWLVIHSLQDLKAKLGSVIVLVLAVNFLSHLVEWQNGRETLEFGLAVAAVSATLIAFGRFGEKD